MGFSIPHLLVVLGIVIIVFGTTRLRNLGSDLGSAIKGFRSALKDDEKDAMPELEVEDQIINTGTLQQSTKKSECV